MLTHTIGIGLTHTQTIVPISLNLALSKILLRFGLVQSCHYDDDDADDADDEYVNDDDEGEDDDDEDDKLNIVQDAAWQGIVASCASTRCKQKLISNFQLMSFYIWKIHLIFGKHI